MAKDVDAEREAQRARPAPTANELRVLAKRLRAVAKAIFQSGKLDIPFVKGECAAIPHPLVTGWYTRANAWDDKEQKRLFGTICSLLAKMYSGQAAESPTERLESLATDVDALAVTLEWPNESDQQKIAVAIHKLVTTLEQYAPLKGEPAKFVNDDRSRAAATAHSRISDANFQLRHLVNPDDDDPDCFRDIEQSPVLLEDQRDALHTVAQITQDLLSLYGTGQALTLRPFFYWYPGRCPDVPREWVDALSAAKTRLGSRKEPVVGTSKQQSTQKRPGINARMLEAMQENPSEVMGWSSARWAEHLKCVKSSIVETPTWKDLMMARDRVKAERAVDRRRKPKASDQNRTK